VLNSQLIGGVMIDWDKIDRDSYLRNIDAINQEDHITFTHSVTFLLVRTAAVNPHCWRRLPLLMVSIRKAGRGTITSPPTISTLNYAAQFAFPVVSGVPGTVIS